MHAAVTMARLFPADRSKTERLAQEATDTCATHAGPVWDVKDKDHQKQKMTMTMALCPQLSHNFDKTRPQINFFLNCCDSVFIFPFLLLRPSIQVPLN